MLASLVALSLLSQTPDNYPDTWKKVEQIISTSFYDREARKDEMGRLLKEGGDSALKAKNRLEFRDSVLDMIEKFKASHFDYLTEEDQGYYSMDNILGGKTEMPQIGAWFKKGRDGYTVQMVLNGSEAEAQGIWKGDKVVSADGQPFQPIRSFENKDSVTLTLQRNGQTVTKTVKPTKMGGLAMFLKATKDSVKIIEQDGKKIGYFHLWTMVSNDFRNAVADALNKGFNTDAFIIDIRDGFGGRPEGFFDKFFLPGNKIEWNFGGISTTQYMGYGKPVVVLINEGSRSAKEVAAHLFKSSKRATLVGTNTAGHVLGTSPRRVNEWSILEVPMVSLKVDGIDLEGRGVAPDVVVKPEFGPDGKDMILAKGLEIALRQAK